MQAQTDFPASIRLRPGQSWHCRVERGTLVLALQGKVSVREAPRWLGEQFFSREISVSEGQPHTLQCDGWMVLQARGAAHVACIAPLRSERRSMAYWRAMIATCLAKWRATVLGRRRRGPGNIH